ncbi:MAG: T9SS type A sorting domain-containing protein [Saprospiraceae bacterium]
MKAMVEGKAVYKARARALNQFKHPNTFYSDAVLCNVESQNYIIKEPDAKRGFALTPNPATDMVQLRIPNKNQEPTEVELYDIAGKMVMNFTAIDKLVYFNTANLHDGIYFVSCTNQETQQKNILKLVIQH